MRELAVVYGGNVLWNELELEPLNAPLKEVNFCKGIINNSVAASLIHKKIC